jgi:hypothetical protein
MSKPEPIRFPNDTAEPEGFCAEPRVLSNEVWELRREVAAMREALLQLVEALQQQKSESPITKEAAS